MTARGPSKASATLDLVEPDPTQLALVGRFAKCVRQLGKQLQCAVCLSLYRRPTSTPCGHTFCRECVMRSLSTKPACPLCQSICKPRELREDDTLANVLSHFKALHPRIAKAAAPVADGLPQQQQQQQQQHDGTRWEDDDYDDDSSEFMYQNDMSQVMSESQLVREYDDTLGLARKATNAGSGVAGGSEQFDHTHPLTASETESEIQQRRRNALDLFSGGAETLTGPTQAVSQNGRHRVQDENDQRSVDGVALRNMYVTTPPTQIVAQSETPASKGNNSNVQGSGTTKGPQSAQSGSTVATEIVGSPTWTRSGQQTKQQGVDSAGGKRSIDASASKGGNEQQKTVDVEMRKASGRVAGKRPVFDCTDGGSSLMSRLDEVAEETDVGDEIIDVDKDDVHAVDVDVDVDVDDVDDVVDVVDAGVDVDTDVGEKIDDLDNELSRQTNVEPQSQLHTKRDKKKKKKKIKTKKQKKMKENIPSNVTQGAGSSSPQDNTTDLSLVVAQATTPISSASTGAIIARTTATAAGVPSQPSLPAKESTILEQQSQQQAPAAPAPTARPALKYRRGNTVTIKPRMHSGSNKPGGVARIKKINPDGTLHVKYILGGSEVRLDPVFVVCLGIDMDAASTTGTFGTVSSSSAAATASARGRSTRRQGDGSKQVDKSETRNSISLSGRPVRNVRKRKVDEDDEDDSDTNAKEDKKESAARKSKRQSTSERTSKSPGTVSDTDEQVSENRGKGGNKNKRTTASTPSAAFLSNKKSRNTAAAQDLASSWAKSSTADTTAATAITVAKKTKAKVANNNNKNRAIIQEPRILVSVADSDKVKKAVERFGGSVVFDEMDATHCIVKSVAKSKKSQGHRLSMKRTLKYLKSLASGLWVVNQEWVSRSTKLGYWSAEEPFEVEGDMTTWTAMGGASSGGAGAMFESAALAEQMLLGGPRRARLVKQIGGVDGAEGSDGASGSNGGGDGTPRKMLLESVAVYFCGGFDKSPSLLTDLRQLLVLTGGLEILATDVKAFDEARSKMLAEASGGGDNNVRSNPAVDNGSSSSSSSEQPQSAWSNMGRSLVVICQEVSHARRGEHFEAVRRLDEAGETNLVSHDWLFASLCTYRIQDLVQFRVTKKRGLY